MNTSHLTANLRKRAWRGPFFRSYLVVFIGYMCMYLIRKNFNVSQNDLIEQHGLTKTDLGTIGFWFSITYGIGKSVVGYYGDGKNTKSLVAILLMISGFCVLGFSSVIGSVAGMTFFFALNGFFQSAGGPLSYSTITKWTPGKWRGTFLGLWNMSHNVGGALAAVVATFGAEQLFDGDVKGMFILPALIAIVVGFIGLWIGSDSPETYGLGKVEEIFGEPLSVEDTQVASNPMSKWVIFKKYVLKNPYVWALGFANVCVYVVRIGVDQWGIVYAREVLGMSKEVAKQGFTLFEVGALSGALFWGGISDFLKGRRALVSMIALALILGALKVYEGARTEEILLASMFSLGFLIFGPQLLVCVAALRFMPKSAVSVGNGVLGTFAYLLGDSFAKLGLGMMADNKVVLGLTGWSGTFKAMFFAAITGILILAYVAIAEERKIRATSSKIRFE
ncbi:MAG: hexose-6-phosphate:phosphate antiporter [Bdellovibrionales bacterium]|nr:hexose-6-phosphate:phosphate antiporter [Bdellovibrionales bacterium]